jgi:methanogenic corrinoid protein MtbC1
MAIRLSSGHRRYLASDVDWLRAMHELMAYGHRPGKLIVLAARELDALLRAEREVRMGDHRAAAWLDAFRKSGAPELRRRFRAVMDELGPAEGVQQVVAGFVERVGLEWAEGRLSIAQEHAVTEVLEDLLRGERARVSAARVAPASGPRVLLATLSGERHGLGLQMAALVLEARGSSTTLLGVDLPAGEIAGAAARSGVAAVGLSVSLSHAGAEHGQQVQELRRLLPESVALLVGGLGARAACRGLRDVQLFQDLGALGRWAEHARRTGAAGRRRAAPD